MKTLLLCPALFATHGGIERILRLYLKALCELATPRDRIALAVLNDTAIAPDQLSPFATSALGPILAGRRKKAVFALRTLMLARHADRIVCGHVNFLPLLRLARLVNRRVRRYLIAHGIEVWRPFSASESATLAGLERILCVSDFTRREMLRQLPGIEPQRLVLQPNALDPQFSIAPAAAGAAAPGLILTVARLSLAESYKGIDHLIEALPAIRAAVPHAHLRIVGDGDARPGLEALAKTRGVADAVAFCGRVSDEELRAHLGACQLFALPSRGEGFGLVYLEALAHGKPCLAADAGGAPEVIDSSSGILVPFGNPAALAAGCIAALGRSWDPAALHARAEMFSFPNFRARLATLLPAS